MFLKTLGIIFMLGGSTLIGFILGESLKGRVIQLKEIEQALYVLQNEIVYSRTSLPDIFTHVSEKCNKPISNIFLEISNLLRSNKVDSVYEGFQKVLLKNNNDISLKKEDINVIMDMARTLGESDIEGQKSILLLTINNIQKQIKEADSIMKKNIKMYRYLGFSFGAVLTIMIL